MNELEKKDTPWTPGPWIIHEQEIYISPGIRIGTNQYTLATVADPKGDKRGPANGRLIASAPDLYDALARCASALSIMSPGGFMDPDVVAANVALKKARGEE